MRYTVHGSLTVSVSVDVEADSESEAMTIAGEWEVPELCIECSGNNSQFLGDPNDIGYAPFSLDTDGTPNWDRVEKSDS